MRVIKTKDKQEAKITARNRIRHERSYRDTVPIAGVSVFFKENMTPISRTHGKMLLVCPMCLLAFERYACHVGRRGQKESYCSVACAAAARVHDFKARCKVCGKEFPSIKSNLSRVTTCSGNCLREYRREHLPAGFIAGRVSRGPQPKQQREFKGQVKTIEEWAMSWGCSYHSAWGRLKRYRLKQPAAVFDEQDCYRGERQ